MLTLLLAVTLVATPSTWASTFAQLPTYGDGNSSCAIDSGRVAFTTGDAISRYDGPSPHSTITVADSADRARVVQPGYAGLPPYQAVPDHNADGSFHWLGPCFYASSHLYVLAPLVRPDGSGIRTDLLSFRVPFGGSPRYDAGYLLPSTPGVDWSGGVFYDKAAGWVYLFGTSHAATDDWTGRDVYAARTTIQSVTQASAWRFYRAGTGWSAAAPTPWLVASRDGGVDLSFSVWRDLAGWHVVSRLGGPWGSPEADRWTSKGIGWSWSRSKLASLPPDAYLVMDHREIKPGLLTYNQAGKPATWLLAG
jgi:hypothetical protein